MVDEIRHWIVYMYTFPNDKKYIGKTKRTLAQRQGVNFINYRNCSALWAAIQKYGVENIQQTILFEGNITSQEASVLEQKYIALYKTNCNRYYNPKYGYNLTDGGEGVSGYHPDDERLEILRKQMHYFHELQKGTHHSKEAREKMRQAKLGKKRGAMSEETKRKISQANSRENMTEETRKRRSKAVKKMVVAEHNETHEQLVFESLEEAAKFFGVRTSAISRWGHGQRKPSNGYTFTIYPRTTTEREELCAA